MLPVSGMSSWSSCFREIADTVEHIASHVNISAICHVDEDSGLPQYRITGNVVFTQPVTITSRL